MAAGAVKLPPGFELEENEAPTASDGMKLPPGFVLEGPALKDAPKDVPKAKSAALGAAEGASLGFGDEGGAATVALAKKLRSLLPGQKPTDLVNDYTGARDSLRANINEAKEANPKTFLTGELAGGMATAPITGEATIAKMAALGAMQGLGGSTADLTKGDVGGAAWDTAKGGMIGGAVGLGGKALAALTPTALKDLARSSALRALGYTKRFLNSPEKIAAADKTAQTLLDQGMIRPLDSAEDLAGKVHDLIDSSGKKIGGYLKSRGTGYKTADAIEAIESLRPMDANGNVLRGGHYDKLNGAIDEGLATLKAHGDIIPYEEANGVKSLLQKIGKFGSSTSEKDMERAVAGKMRGSIDDSLEKLAKDPKILQTEPMVGKAGEVMPKGGAFEALSPDDSMKRFQEFLNQKKLYGAGQEAEDALANRLSSEQGNKRLGLTDTITAAPIAAAEMATGGLPLGTAAAVGAKKFGEKFGNTTTAYWADKGSKFIGGMGDRVAKLVGANPAALGKYAGMFTKAAAQGAQGVAMRHWVLSNTDPEYRTMLENLPKENGDANPSSE